MAEFLTDIPLDIEEEKILTKVKHQVSDSDSDAADSGDEGPSDRQSVTIRRPPTKLSLHLKGLMGEANLRYAKGDLDTAKKMCFEVIRQAPLAYEPYDTLAQMYENVNMEKYRGYLTLAATVSRSNANIWCRLAEANIQEGLLKEAGRCYTKALRVEPGNIDWHMKRLEVFEKIECKNLLVYKVIMARHMPKKQFENILSICKDVAKIYYDQKNYVRAIEALKVPFNRFPDKVTQDLLNMMLELQLLAQKFTECLDYFTQFCGFTFEILVQEDNSVLVQSYIIPPNLQVDLKMKFIICLIRLGCQHLFSDLINLILIEDDVELVGDLYLDVIEALMSCGYPHDALKLMVPLVKSKNFSMAAVWLKYAECLNSCEMYDQSIEAYYTVMNLAPQHVEVLYPLAMLLLKQNRKSEALKFLSQDLSHNKVDVAVLIEQMRLLKQISDYESYFKCAELLLSRHCIVLKYPEELKIVTYKETPKEKIAKVRKSRLFRNDSGDVERNLVSIREPSVEEEYRIFREILQEAKDQRYFSWMKKFAFMALTSKRFQKEFDEIFLLTYLSCVYNRDYFHGHTIIREILVNNLGNNLVWNLFNFVLQTPDDLRHYRFLERMHHSPPHTKIIMANYLSSIGNATAALGQFMKSFKENRSSYSAFMIALCMLHVSSGKTFDKTKKKIMAENVTYLFMNYARIRSKHARHEALYNVARMYQQFGLNYLAEVYYKKVLEESPSRIVEEHEDVLGLRHEAAFNLHILYKNSGNIIAARNVLMKHIVI